MNNLRIVFSCCFEEGGSVSYPGRCGEGERRSESCEVTTWNTILSSVSPLPVPLDRSWRPTELADELTLQELPLSPSSPLSLPRCRDGPLHQPETVQNCINNTINLNFSFIQSCRLD